MSEAILPDHKPAAFKPETMPSRQRRVACDGPSFSKHPRVYLTMVDDERGQPSHVVCPYCSRTFVFQDSAEGAESH